MKRNEFYIEILLNKDNPRDVHEMINQQNWTDREKDEMHTVIKDYMSGKNPIDWGKEFADYITEHPLSYEKLRDLDKSMKENAKYLDELHKEAKEKVEQLPEQAPRNERLHWKNKEIFTKLQYDSIEKFLELAEKERQKLAPKQSMEKVLEILENSKTLDEMKVLVEEQELTEVEKQHILDFLASDKTNSKEAFELVANDIKNAPAYEGMESWVQQRDELKEKIKDVKDAIERNEDMLEDLQEERDELNNELNDTKAILGKISAEIAILEAQKKDNPEIEISQDLIAQRDDVLQDIKATQEKINKAVKEIENTSEELQKQGIEKMALASMYAMAKKQATQEFMQQHFYEPTKKGLDQVKEGLDDVTQKGKQLTQNIKQTRQQVKAFNQQINDAKTLDKKLKSLVNTKVFNSIANKIDMTINGTWLIARWQKKEKIIDEKTNNIKEQAATILRKEIEKENKRNEFANKMNPNGPQKHVKSDAEINKEISERAATLEKAKAVIKERNDNSKIPLFKKISNMHLDRQAKNIKRHENKRDELKKDAIPTMQKYVKAVEQRESELRDLQKEVEKSFGRGQDYGEFGQSFNEGQFGQYDEKWDKKFQNIEELRHNAEHAIENGCYQHTFGQDVQDFMEKYKDEIFDLGNGNADHEEDRER